ncbi:Chaperone protein dnaJ 49 [Apostasia shenzhenica]|uniref:Chaperone protein dnaJ 49 n=1 Tax=Apostasia shenzhenica TaxID=1088818 RepID=A0A2I0AHA5_9ASPA|nr:Chaperone protein dnaJ 49 [Apostasia shenzhenica]
MTSEREGERIKSRTYLELWRSVSKAWMVAMRLLTTFGSLIFPRDWVDLAACMCPMDCNKEEASRARDIAEMKMQSRDFIGAKKLVLKALHLLPDIENASQMLTVCEVHCSASFLVNGQTDYYGVLQVESSADDTLIKKQFRKLALQLHPDKNKFAGAEGAFKLVSEAYKVLSDQANRRIYDAKVRVNMKNVCSYQPSKHAMDAWRYTGAKTNQQPQSLNFWTICVFCKNQFQYVRSCLNKEVECQKCFKKFYAFEMNPQNIPPTGSSSGYPWSHPYFHQPDNPVQRDHRYVSQTHFINPSGARVVENLVKRPKQGCGSTVKEEKVELAQDDSSGKTKVEEMRRKDPVVNPSSKAGRMRNRRVVHSSDSESAESDSTDTDDVLEVNPAEPTVGPSNSRYPRRSTRHKVNVDYKEDRSEDDDDDDDDDELPRKRLRKGMSYRDANHDSNPEVATNGLKEDAHKDPISANNLPSTSGLKKGIMDETKETTVNEDERTVRTSSNIYSNIDHRPSRVVPSFSYPDPEFFDFDKDRDSSKFDVNQIWTAYDDEWDAMPRYYALVHKVHRPNFKLYYTWLEYNPTSASEKAWSDARLPIACGNFRPGRRCSTNNQQMFSHLMSFSKAGGNMYNIYPKKGQVWALFKDWDIGWSSAAETPKTFEYEFVEVLSNFQYGKDFVVCSLDKVNGFLYLFARDHNKGITRVPCGHLLRFSHCIPHYRIYEEREGIPRDSFELDPAALPQDFVSITKADSVTQVEAVDVESCEPCAMTMADERTGTIKTNGNTCQTSGVRHENFDHVQESQYEASETPLSGESFASADINGENDDEDSKVQEEVFADPEFCDFQEERSEEKFKPGQIWALYSEIDKYPNYYGWVKKVQWEESGCILLKWLEFYPRTEEDKLWLEKGLPFGCGRFKVIGGVEKFDSTNAFSHLVDAKTIRKNVYYDIYPNNGEVWAVFKNRSLTWSSADREKSAEYHVVLVIARDDCAIKALPLTKVKGYKYVFMRQAGEAEVQMPANECLSFSHKIPAFRLTDQESGNLRDCWELDPASIPPSLLNTGL